MVTTRRGTAPIGAPFITWGTGPALVDIFVRQLRVTRLRFAHRLVVGLIVEGNAVTFGVRAGALG